MASPKKFRRTGRVIVVTFGQRWVSFLIFLVVIIPMVLLGYWIYRPERWVEVSIRANTMSHITFQSTKFTVQPDGQGTVIANLAGAADIPEASQLVLSITPPYGSQAYAQECCTIANGRFFGVFQLGSAAYPVRRDEEYAFQLTSADAPLLHADGVVSAHVIEIAGGGRLFALFADIVGAIGALLQLLKSVRRRPVAELDPEEFYDFQVNLPTVSVTENETPQHRVAHDPLIPGGA